MKVCFGRKTKFFQGSSDFAKFDSSMRMSPKNSVGSKVLLVHNNAYCISQLVHAL